MFSVMCDHLCTRGSLSHDVLGRTKFVFLPAGRIRQEGGLENLLWLSDVCYNIEESFLPKDKR